MLFKGGKMDQVAIKGVSRYSITDGFPCLRGYFSYYNPNPFQNPLNVFWEPFYILVNIGWLVRFHIGNDLSVWLYQYIMTKGYAFMP